MHAYLFMNYESLLDVNAFISTLRIFCSISIIDLLVSIVIELWSSHLLFVIINIAFRHTQKRKLNIGWHILQISRYGAKQQVMDSVHNICDGSKLMAHYIILHGMCGINHVVEPTNQSHNIMAKCIMLLPNSGQVSLKTILSSISINSFLTQMQQYIKQHM